MDPGEFVAVMGPSGCGKSTLLNLVAGLDLADEGEIILDGEDITGRDEDWLARMRRQHIGIVFQFFNLLEGMTALENVVLPAMVAGRRRKAAETRARDLLDLLGLGDRAEELPAVLSGGQRQRLAIARALANEPTLLLADEPTGALDSDGGREVLELFRRLHDDGQTILMVTHSDEVAAGADRIVRHARRPYRRRHARRCRRPGRPRHPRRRRSGRFGGLSAGWSAPRWAHLDQGGRPTMGAVRLIARVELRRGWPSLLGVAVIVALVSGAVLAALVGARRTSTTVDRFRDWAAASDVTYQAADEDRAEAVLAAVRDLPEIETATSRRLVNGFPLDQSVPDIAVLSDPDGVYGKEVDRPRLLAGRLPDPDSPDEILLNEQAAHLTGLGPGDQIRVRTWRADDLEALFGGADFPGFNGPELDLRIVGVGRTPEELPGDVRRGSLYALGSPAFMAAHPGVGSWPPAVVVRLRGGGRGRGRRDREGPPAPRGRRGGFGEQCGGHRPHYRGRGVRRHIAEHGRQPGHRSVAVRGRRRGRGGHRRRAGGARGT